MTTSTIIGEYYFEEFIESHPWFRPLSNAMRYLSYPFCIPIRKKLYFRMVQMINSTSLYDPVYRAQYDAVTVHSNGHLLDMELKAHAQVCDLMIITRAARGKAIVLGVGI